MMYLAFILGVITVMSILCSWWISIRDPRSKKEVLS